MLLSVVLCDCSLVFQCIFNAYVAKKSAHLSKTIHTAMMLAIVGGIFLAFVGFFGARPIMKMMQSPPEVLDLSVIYLKIYFLCMPAMLLYNYGAAILRAIGDTRRPLYYLTFAGVVNVVLNLILVIVFRMDVAGVALATIVAQYISAGLVLRCLLKETGPLHLDLKRLRLEWPVVRQIMQIGLPAGFQGVLFSLSNVVIQSSLNSFDDAVIVAGSSAAANIEGFVYVAMNAFAQASGEDFANDRILLS